jgi:hypothetical protein
MVARSEHLYVCQQLAEFLFILFKVAQNSDVKLDESFVFGDRKFGKEFEASKGLLLQGRLNILCSLQGIVKYHTKAICVKPIDDTNERSNVLLIFNLFDIWYR